MSGLDKANGKLDVASWNMAAINNNPFEYWITSKDKAYNKMMDDVAAFIESPGEGDVLVSEVLTPQRFLELKELLAANGMDEQHIALTEELYQSDFSKRKVISEFMKDKDLGKKRLASMPDRMTNTINIVQGNTYRPTVINCYEGDLGSLDQWWAAWKNFMFQSEFEIFGENGPQKLKAVSLLAPIKRSKYPAITPEEEAISLPLQTMAAAIFDGILVNMMNTVAKDDWQRLRSEMCRALNKKKNDRTLEILSKTYAETDIVFLQEVAAAFLDKAKAVSLNSIYDILTPQKLDGKRDQNSIIFLRKGLFQMDTVQEVTEKALAKLDQSTPVPVADGDLFAVSVKDRQGTDYLLASFHGDTNGLATIPIVTSVHQLAQDLGHPRLIFGLDANTYEKGGANLGLQDMMEFVRDFTSKGISSVWGADPDPTNYTTYNARTYLQPQLNKALRSEEKRAKGDINPKDFILFYEDQIQASNTKKDNTGKKEYIEEMVFPTLDFPSDHGILSSRLSLLDSK